MAPAGGLCITPEPYEQDRLGPLLEITTGQ